MEQLSSKLDEYLTIPQVQFKTSGVWPIEGNAASPPKKKREDPKDIFMKDVWGCSLFAN